MHTTLADPTTTFLYLFNGIYCLVIWIPLAIMDCMSNFNRVDKSTDTLLERAEWPRLVTVPLDILLHYLTKGIFHILISIYCCFCPQTLLVGMLFLFSGIFYILAVVHCEKPLPITGMM